MIALLKVQYSETITKADACFFDGDSSEIFSFGAAPFGRDQHAGRRRCSHDLLGRGTDLYVGRDDR